MLPVITVVLYQTRKTVSEVDKEIKVTQETAKISSETAMYWRAGIEQLF